MEVLEDDWRKCIERLTDQRDKVMLSLLYSQVKTELLLYLVQHRLFIKRSSEKEEMSHGSRQRSSPGNSIVPRLSVHHISPDDQLKDP